MIQPEQIAFVDYETHWSDTHTLNKMNVEQYVRNPEFEVIGVGAELNGKAHWFEHAEFQQWTKSVDWAVTAFAAHNCNEFDAFIASQVDGVNPCLWVDTQAMSRVFLPADVGKALEKIAAFFGVGVKGKEVVLAKGMHRKDFDEHDWAAYGLYCLTDVALMKACFYEMVDSIPDEEFALMDLTCRMMTEPIFEGDTKLLEQFIDDEKKRKRDLLERLIRETEGQIVSADDTAALKKILMSNDKLAAMLVLLGVEPPMKVSAKKSAKAGKPVLTYAFAKSDPGMQALLEHEDDDVRFLAEARVGIKSTINETRGQRFLGMAQRGPMPVLLRYHGAHTSRWSGSGRMNMQNLPRGGKLRGAMRAPEERT